MNQTVQVQGRVTEKEAGEQLKQQLAQYVQQQSSSIQAFHKWMKGVEVLGIVLIAAAFGLALYVSIAWKSFDQKLIPAAWFIFAASGGPLLLASGIHTLILRAFPASLLPAKDQKLVTGRGAQWIGGGFIIGGLLFAGFWGLFAFASWTTNWDILTPLITVAGAVMGAMIVVSMLLAVIQQLNKSR